MSGEGIKDTVRAKYGQAAIRVLGGNSGACGCDPVSSNLYAAVDVVISNCVINLSADKRRVLGEAFRVLRPGGRFAVSDVVVRGEIPAAVRRSMELWVGCVAGALEEQEYRRLLADAGFVDVGVEPTRIYEFADARAALAGAGLDAEVLAREGGRRIMGAFVRATRPV